MCAGAGAFLKRQDKRWFIWLYNGQAHALDLCFSCMHFDWSIWFVRAVAMCQEGSILISVCFLNFGGSSPGLNRKWNLRNFLCIRTTVWKERFRFRLASVLTRMSYFRDSLSSVTHFHITKRETSIELDADTPWKCVSVNWLTLEICLRKQSENRMKASKNVSSLTSFHTQPMNLFRTRTETVKKIKRREREKCKQIADCWVSVLPPLECSHTYRVNFWIYWLPSSTVRINGTRQMLFAPNINIIHTSKCMSS